VATTTADPPTKLGILERAGYTADDIAALVPCSTRHVRRLDSMRAIPGRFALGRLVRWHRRLVDEWIAAGCPLLKKGGGR
jgi:predicted DNA-binding transcriptional regulator AlpA